MIQVLDGPKKKGASLSVLTTNEKELVRDVVVNGSPGCCDHQTVEFNILKTLGCKRMDIALLRV